MTRGVETVKKMNTWIERKIDELFGLDLRSLAFARVILASTVLLDLIIRTTMFSIHYGNQSIFPTYAFKYDWFEPGLWSITYLNGSLWLTAIVFGVAFISTLFLLLGWHTRLASIATWASVYSIQNANPIILQGGDMYIHILLFLGIFVPWGKCFSVDSSLSFEKIPKRALTFWTGAYVIQIASIYFFAYYAKTSPVWHAEGTGVYYALQIDQLVTPFGHFMSQFYPLLMILTFAVLTMQHMAAYLILSPYRTVVTRTAAVTALIFMHTSFMIFLHLGPFSWVSIAGLVALLPTRFWDMLIRFSIRKKFGGLTMFYDGECGFCKKSVYLLRTFLLLPQTAIAQAQTDARALAEMRRVYSWVIQEPNGTLHTEYDAFVTLLRYSPVGVIVAPVFGLSFARSIGTHVYRYVAKHRSRTCMPEIEAPTPTWETRLRFYAMIASSLLAIFYISYTTTWNLSKAPAFNQYVQVPKSIQMIGPLFGWQQHWAMFAPYPYTDDGWLILLARKADGSEIDVMRGGPYLRGTAPASYEKPAVVADLYPNERIRKYSMNMGHNDFARFRKYLTQYLCTSLNKGVSAKDQVVHVEIIYMLERSVPYGQTPTIEKQILETRDCILPPPVAPTE